MHYYRTKTDVTCNKTVGFALATATNSRRGASSIPLVPRLQYTSIVGECL
jgi:hypothetical protein